MELWIEAIFKKLEYHCETSLSIHVISVDQQTNPISLTTGKKGSYTIKMYDYV